MNDSTRNATISGAASGGILGGVGSTLAGGGMKAALRAALLGALTGGAVSGAGQAAGSAVLGDPEEGEINPYTRRGVLGGGLAGAGMGGLLGAALSRKFLRVPGAKGALSALAGKSTGRAAGLGALGGGAFGGYQAGDEGMQLDFIQSEMDAMRKKRKAELLGQRLMDEGYPSGGEPE